MNAPVIETIVVIARAIIVSDWIVNSAGRPIVFTNGVIFRMSRIMMKNITKTMKKTIVSRTLISVDSLWRFSPKNPPISFCHVGDIVIVSFHGLSLANCLTSISFRTFSSAGVSSAKIRGVTNRINKANIVNPLFII